VGSETKSQLAEDRTDLAEDRTVLANERTLASWHRTAYAAIGIGLAFNALFERMEPEWLPKAIATGFLLIACAIFLLSERRSQRVLSRLSQHQVPALGAWKLRLIAWSGAAGALALAAAIWFARITPPAS
jgi:putative membrane protein